MILPSFIAPKGVLACHGNFQHLCAMAGEVENWVYKTKSQCAYSRIIFDARFSQAWMSKSQKSEPLLNTAQCRFAKRQLTPGLYLYEQH